MENETISVSSGDVVDYDVMYNAVYDATVAASLDLEVTDGQTINSSALEYFKGILSNQRFPRDYVIYVGEPYTYNSGYNERTAYEYCMVTGDLECNGTSFNGIGDVYSLRVSGDVGVSLSENQEVSLSVPLYYGRSNLGKFSGVIDRDWSGILLLICMSLGGAVWLVRKILRIGY